MAVEDLSNTQAARKSSWRCCSRFIGQCYADWLFDSNYAIRFCCYYTLVIVIIAIGLRIKHPLPIIRSEGAINNILRPAAAAGVLSSLIQLVWFSSEFFLLGAFSVDPIEWWIYRNHTICNEPFHRKQINLTPAVITRHWLQRRFALRSQRTPFHI